MQVSLRNGERERDGFYRETELLCRLEMFKSVTQQPSVLKWRTEEERESLQIYRKKKRAKERTNETKKRETL